MEYANFQQVVAAGIVDFIFFLLFPRAELWETNWSFFVLEKTFDLRNLVHSNLAWETLCWLCL